jgi:hypothetical protein
MVYSSTQLDISLPIRVSKKKFISKKYPLSFILSKSLSEIPLDSNNIFIISNKGLYLSFNLFILFLALCRFILFNKILSTDSSKLFDILSNFILSL